MVKRYQKNHTSISAEDRHQWALERKALEGRIIGLTPEEFGHPKWNEEFRGCLVKQHINGSMYELQLINGSTKFASHHKSSGTWSWWEERN